MLLKLFRPPPTPDGAVPSAPSRDRRFAKAARSLRRSLPIGRHPEAQRVPVGRCDESGICRRNGPRRCDLSTMQGKHRDDNRPAFLMPDARPTFYSRRPYGFPTPPWTRGHWRECRHGDRRCLHVNSVPKSVVSWKPSCSSLRRRWRSSRCCRFLFCHEPSHGSGRRDDAGAKADVSAPAIS